MLNEDWKKEYKTGMDRVSPSRESIDNLLNVMTSKASARNISPRTLRRLMPFAACFLLVAALAIPLSKQISGGRSVPLASGTGGQVAAPYVDLSGAAPASEDKFSAATAPASTPSSEISSPATRTSLSPSETASSDKGDYSELYNVMSKLQSKGTVRAYTSAGAESANKAPSAPASDSAASQGYSDTNIQVAGVQESDIVKTDGKYIYSLAGEKLSIVKAENGALAMASQIPISVKDSSGRQSSGAFEMYVSGDRLIVLRNSYEYHIMAAEPESSNDSRVIAPSIWPPRSKSFVSADIYDISDRTSPKLLNSFSQDGSFVSSRMIDGVLYLLSNKGVYGEIVRERPDTFVPQVYCGAEASLISQKDISVGIDPEKSGGSAQYLIVAGIDTSGNGKLVSNKAVLGYGSQIYSSRTNLYVTSYSGITEGSTYTGATKLHRFSLNSGNISLEAEGTVPGSVLNQFSMDEHAGCFRIVTTVYSYTVSVGGTDKSAWSSVSQSRQYNSLYTLDSNLKIKGKIEDLAPGERVYSARFIGDTAYFVTFRQVDPLFAADLSDPANPRILSALKIPGFSQYLHPYSDGLLFGLGHDADADSGKAGYLKLSMFDISDPKNVKELSKLVIDGTYYSEASYNHKAVLADAAKNIIAFPADGKYLIYSYSREQGFKREASISAGSSMKYGYNMRGLYIGDVFYVVSAEGISSYAVKGYSQISKISF